MIEVLFTEEATDNLISQALFIYKLTLNVEKSDKYLLTMKSHIIQSLSYFPKLGRPAPEYGENIRKLVHQNYSILYHFDEETIHIITIYRENIPNI